MSTLTPVLHRDRRLCINLTRFDTILLPLLCLYGLNVSLQHVFFTIFLLAQVISMSQLRDAVREGNIQACWLTAVFVRAIHTT